MKNVILSLVIVGLRFSLSCGTQASQAPAQSPEIVARLHFAGFEQLSTTTNATTLRELWGLPVTAEMRDQALDKIARSWARSLTPRTNTSAPEAAPLIRPLLDDFLRSESYFEVRGQTNRPLEWTLAIRLSEERRQLWQTNWGQLSSGWDLKSARRTNPISFTAIDSWFLLGPGSGGQGGFPTNAPILERIRTNGRPIAAARDYWLKAEADLPRLARRLPNFGSRKLPSAELTVSGRGPSLRSQGRLTFPEPIAWPSAPWRIPTNTITDPAKSLISFTAAQGLAPWLSHKPLVNKLGLKPAPDQFFMWGQSHAPFQVLAALRVPNATNFLEHFTAQWVPRLNSNLVQHVGELELPTNRLAVVWRGLPIILPYVHPAPEPGGDYLMAGVFPLAPSTNPAPAPPALFEQLTGRTNLLYYDWEITQSRIAQLRPLIQLLSMFTTIPHTDTNSLSSRWLEAVEPKLGNTITELSVTSPTELTFVRNAHVGFNGLELVALAYWLESPNFPRLDYRIAFRTAPVRKRD